MKVASDWVNNNGYVAKTGSSSLKNTVMSGRSMVSRRGVHRGILHETGPIDRHGLRGGQLSLPLCNDHRASAVNRPRARNRQLLWFLWFSFVVPTPRGSKCIWSCLNRYGFHRTYNSMGTWSRRNSFIAWTLHELAYVWRCLKMFEDAWILQDLMDFGRTSCEMVSDLGEILLKYVFRVNRSCLNPRIFHISFGWILFEICNLKESFLL